MFTTPKLTEEEGKPGKGRVRTLNFIVDHKCYHFYLNLTSKSGLETPN